MFIFWEKVRCPFFQILLLLNQVEVNQPVVRTVGNISTAIAQSEFGTSVQRGVQVSNFKLNIRVLQVLSQKLPRTISLQIIFI